MDWLNYHHLLYFYTVARAGSMAVAAEQLDVAQPTLSVQIKRLEKRLGEKIFRRVGRGLELTETGRVVYGYAEEIFQLGHEMLQTLKGRPQNRPVKVVVGVADALPKLIVYRLLEPVFGMPEPVQLLCPEGSPEQLVAQMMEFQVDLVLADAPMTGATRMRVFNHLLGDCGITIFAAPKLAKLYRKNFPHSLADAPWLLPLPTAVLRRSLEQWFDELGFRPRIRGEFADSALMKVVGRSGEGVFAVATVIENDVVSQFGVEPIGRIENVRERFYAISAERKIKHPAVRMLTEVGRSALFGGGNET